MENDPLNIEAHESTGPVPQLRVPQQGAPADQQQGQSTEGTESGEQQGEGADELVELDFGGIKRKLQRTELSEMVKKVQEADQIRQQGEQMLMEVASLRGLHDRLKQFSPEQFEAFQKFMADPDAFRNPAAKSPDPMDVFGSQQSQQQQGQQQKLPPELQQKMEQMEQVLQALAQAEQGRLQEQETRSREQVVDEHLDRYEAFKHQSPQAQSLRGIAKRGILSELGSNPNQDVGNLVADYATKMNTILPAALTQQPPAQPQAPSVTRWPNGPSPNGQDMLAGMLSPDQNSPPTWRDSNNPTFGEAKRRAKARVFNPRR